MTPDQIPPPHVLYPATWRFLDKLPHIRYAGVNHVTETAILLTVCWSCRNQNPQSPHWLHELPLQPCIQYFHVGVFAQEAFPTLPPTHREALISGTCPACWKKLFGETSSSIDETHAE